MFTTWTMIILKSIENWTVFKSSNLFAPLDVWSSNREVSLYKKIILPRVTAHNRPSSILSFLADGPIVNGSKANLYPSDKLRGQNRSCRDVKISNTTNVILKIDVSWKIINWLGRRTAPDVCLPAPNQWVGADATAPPQPHWFERNGILNTFKYYVNGSSTCPIEYYSMTSIVWLLLKLFEKVTHLKLLSVRANSYAML